MSQYHAVYYHGNATKLRERSGSARPKRVEIRAEQFLQRAGTVRRDAKDAGLTAQTGLVHSGLNRLAVDLLELPRRVPPKTGRLLQAQPNLQPCVHDRAAPTRSVAFGLNSLFHQVF